MAHVDQNNPAEQLTPRPYSVIEAPSALGLSKRGVEHLPTAVVEAGLTNRLDARPAGRVTPPRHQSKRDPVTRLLNPAAIRDYSYQLADAVGAVLDQGRFPVVLGGDCSILLGSLLALRRRGRFGLLFLDGHADFYQPEAEPNGEVASMDLALATGRGPEILTQFEGRAPLVRDEDVVVFGRRDAHEAESAGSQRIEETEIALIDLAEIRRLGPKHTALRAFWSLRNEELDGHWIHLDCDVLDDDVMPAVDYRLPDGLSWQELETVLGGAARLPGAVGLEVTIYNPLLDPDRSIGQRLVDCLTTALAPGHVTWS